MLIALDPDGRIMLANRFACAVLGWTEPELLGRDWFETCLAPRLRAQVKARFGELLRGDVSIAENAVVTRGGEERIVEWRSTLNRDDSGQVIGTLSSGTDVTDRSHAADAVQAAEERMRFALEAAKVGIWEMDCLTGVIAWSPILEAQYGLAQGAFDGTFASFSALHSPRGSGVGAQNHRPVDEVRHRFFGIAPCSMAGRHGAVAEWVGPDSARSARGTAARGRDFD